MLHEKVVMCFIGQVRSAFSSSAVGSVFGVNESMMFKLCILNRNMNETRLWVDQLLKTFRRKVHRNLT